MLYGGEARAAEAGASAEAARVASLEGFHEFAARCGEAVRRVSDYPGEAAKVLQSLKNDITGVGRNYRISWDAFNRTNEAICRMTGLSPKTFAAASEPQKQGTSPWVWIVVVFIIIKLIAMLASR
jgi:hypothetical protein